MIAAVYIGIELYRENGKENGDSIQGLGFGV